MSGECDKCGKHALECKCMITSVGGRGIISTAPCESTTISINKEYFRKKLSKIIDKWDERLWYGIDEDGKKALLEELLNTLND